MSKFKKLIKQMNQSKKNVIWKGVFLELKCMLVLIIDLTTSQIPHFPKFTSKKTVVQLKNNGHKLFYRSEMEISKVHCQNFASYEQKTILACKFESSSSLSKDMWYKKYITKGQKILYMTKRSYTIKTESTTDSWRFLNHPCFLLLAGSLTGLTLLEKNTTQANTKCK